MLHFKPKVGIVWDVIPFYHDGTYHVFFLNTADTDDDRRNAHAKWGHAVSKDLLHWEELSPAVKCGRTGPDRDRCVTGSVIFAKGKYWMFYTGGCAGKGDDARKRDQYRKTQPDTVCLATSEDSLRWRKYPGNPVLIRDTGKYAWGDWRDPFVFYNEEEKCYWMTVTSRLYDMPDGFGGSVALAKSEDLIHWEVFEPIYAPGNTYPPECTDVFKMGKFWYLVYGYETTRYCLGKSPGGPWHKVYPGTLNNISMYSGKTLWDGKARYMLASIDARKGKADSGAWQTGDCMAFPRKLVQGKNGVLYTKLPAVFERYFRAAKKINLKDMEVVHGNWTLAPNKMSGLGGLFSKALIKGKYRKFYLEARLKASASTFLAGLYFNDGDYFRNILPYQVSLDFVRGDVIFSHKYRGSNEERIAFSWANLAAGREVKLQVIVEDSIVEIFVDDKYSIGTRGYDDPSPGRIGFFVENGALAVKDVRIMALK